MNERGIDKLTKSFLLGLMQPAGTINAHMRPAAKFENETHGLT
jgi:hypothetical protein